MVNLSSTEKMEYIEKILYKSYFKILKIKKSIFKELFTSLKLVKIIILIVNNYNTKNIFNE